jgi:hypothetical protein
LTVHVKPKNQAKTGLYRGTDLRKGTKKLSVTLKVPKNIVASVILKWMKFGTTKTLPRAGRPAKLSNLWRRALVKEVTKNPIVALTELLSSSLEMGELYRTTTISVAFHQLGLYGRVARRKPLLSKWHMPACLEAPTGLSDHKKQDSLV